MGQHLIKRLSKSLHFQVLVGVFGGIALGYFKPSWAERVQFLGEGFIRLIKMLIAPIVFSTVAVGIARMGDAKKASRLGGIALLYFEVASTLALAIGLLVGTVFKPGKGLHLDLRRLDPHAVDGFLGTGHPLHGVDFILSLIPRTVVDAFAQGEMLQVLLVSILSGFALSAMGSEAPKGKALIELIDGIAELFFRIVGLVMRLAPLGAFGAMAFTVGRYGLDSLLNLGKLVATFYLSSLMFVVCVLGLAARYAGVNIFKFLRYIQDEVFIVLGTSSSEAALPGMMQKMEALGCSKPVVGLVIPMGYSFNLDGTSLYLTLAVLFLAQALDLTLSFPEEVALLGVLLLTSKGAAAVTGGGFITLAATLSATGRIPVAALALLLGVDRFMSQARAMTNLIGNGVATLLVAKCECELDMGKLREGLRSGSKG